MTAKELHILSKRLYRSGPLFLRYLQHWRPYICPFEDLIPHIREGSDVLDIGCGSGLLLALSSATGHAFRGVGFDVSRQAIELAKRMTAEATKLSGAELSFFRLDVNEAWPGGEFDIVCVIDVLHHVPPAFQKSFFEMAISKVRPGGTLIYKDMCLRPWWMAQANRLQDLFIARQWIHYMPIATIEKWGTDAGLAVVHRRAARRLWAGHELLVMHR